MTKLERHRLSNANLAWVRCIQNGSAWGVTYWESVQHALRRNGSKTIEFDDDF